MDFSGRRLLVFRIQFSLVRQWLHVASVYEAFWKNFTHFFGFDTKHTIYELCLPSERGWFWYGFGRPQSRAGSTLYFRVHSSSCGAQCGVVHSPFEWLDHRCHCNCRDLVLFGRHVLRECLRRDVVWWWFYSWWCLRFCLGQCEADGWKIFHLLISSFKRSLGVYAC